MSMLMYNFWCDEHGKFEAIVDSSNVDRVPCRQCNRDSLKGPSFHGTIGVFQDYYSEGLGQHITGAKQLRDKCKELGVTPLRPGDKIDYSKRHKEDKQKADQSAHDSAEKFVNKVWGDRLVDRAPIPKIKETIEKERRIADHEKGIIPSIVIASK